MEHALIFIKMSGFACLFVGFLEIEVVGLEDFIGTVVNIKVVDAAEVAEHGADPRVLYRQVALPDGIEGDDAVELQHRVFVLQGAHLSLFGVAEVDAGREQGSGRRLLPTIFMGFLCHY